MDDLVLAHNVPIARLEQAMHRALTAAWRGLRPQAHPREAWPNPLVGATAICAETDYVGWHAESGGPHAEVVALSKAPGAVDALVVTLEPCAHHGKTPPCVEAVIAAGVPLVAVATSDPTAAGGGVAQLRAAGITVIEGLGAPWALAQQRVWRHVAQSGRAFVTVKIAYGMHGEAAARTGRYLTGESARQAVHQLRSQADGVLVSSATVLADDPRLDVRLPGYAGRQPRPIIVDRHASTPAHARVLGRAPLVFTTAAASSAAVEALTQAGATCVVTDGSLRSVMQALPVHGLGRVLAEPGPRLLAQLLEEDCVDRLVTHEAATAAGDSNGPAFDLDHIARSTKAWHSGLWRAFADGDTELIRDRPFA